MVVLATLRNWGRLCCVGTGIRYNTFEMNNRNDVKRLPDFLGIGAQRTGTTWLWENLRRHPEIWLPERKEIHYFERSTTYPFYRQRPEALARKRKLLARRVIDDVRRGDWREIVRDLRFLAGRNDDGWYASLFTEAGERVAGEITPAYSTLPSRQIEHIHTIMPQAKIILLVRNPIDRAWSAVKFGVRWRTGRPLDPATFSMDDLRRIVGTRRFQAQGDYERTITQWRQHFPAEQFFTGFFDDIVHRPAWFLSTVFGFLGVDASEKHVTSAAFERANPSREVEMRPEFRSLLAEIYYPQLVSLSDFLGGHAVDWRREAEGLLQRLPGTRTPTDRRG